MLGYRAVFHAEDRPDRLLDQAVEEFRRWLADKGGPRYDGGLVQLNAVTKLAPHARALLLEQRDGLGTRAVRARLTELNDGRTWTTQLTASVAAGGDPWIWLDVDGPEFTADGSDRQWTSTPRLGIALLGTADAYDGLGELNRQPTAIGAADVPGLIEVLRDPARRGLVFVAGAPVPDPGAERYAQVAAALSETIGLAGGYVLDDAATRAFAAAAGPHHAVPAGTIRGFVRAAYPGDPLDAQRHRTHPLPWPAAAEDVRVLAYELGRQARLVGVRRELPAALADLDAALERAANGVATVPAPRRARRLPARPAAADPGVRAEGRLDEVARDLDAARRDLAETRELLTDAEAEHAATQHELERVTRECTALRVELSRAGRGDIAWQPAEEQPDARPQSFSDLLSRLDDLKFVRFTGDRRTTLRLGEHGAAQVWAGKCWQALTALDDYARAKNEGAFQGNVHRFLVDAPPPFNRYSAERHAVDESETVRTTAKYRDRRIFDVPPAVRHEGRIFMGAHFKIATAGTVSPRLHYHDATMSTGLVYVGHIGPHLPTGDS